MRADDAGRVGGRVAGIAENTSMAMVILGIGKACAGFRNVDDAPPAATS
jgi:hypothetical protein